MIFLWFFHFYKFQELFMKFSDFSMIFKQIWISMIFQELWEPWYMHLLPSICFILNDFSIYGFACVVTTYRSAQTKDTVPFQCIIIFFFINSLIMSMLLSLCTSVLIYFLLNTQKRAPHGPNEVLFVGFNIWYIFYLCKCYVVYNTTFIAGHNRNSLY